LLALAADPTVRARTLSTVNMLEAGAGTVRSLAGYAQDASPEVRAAVYEKLGSARAERPLALRALEDAAARETDEAARELAAASLRRLGAR
ncbi:MAG: hypothetical protein HYY17_04200, partial [Planctomycetes bacterium]|nr:hypothetical protein [Planctomycetota bacterium]